MAENPGPFDSKYIPNPDVTKLDEPAFTASMRLGDNSSLVGGIPEYLLNGKMGQLAWGSSVVDGVRCVNSDTNHPALNSQTPTAKHSGNCCRVHLSIPPGMAPQTPAQLVVAGRPPLQYLGDPYGAIKYVMVQAFVKLGDVPSSYDGPALPSHCVKVIWHRLSILFQDRFGNQTSNPMAMPTPLASVCMGSTLPSDQRWMISSLAAQPSSAFPIGPNRVEIQGGFELVSTDPRHANYGDGLSSTSMEGRIIVAVADPAGMQVFLAPLPVAPGGPGPLPKQKATDADRPAPKSRN